MNKRRETGASATEYALIVAAVAAFAAILSSIFGDALTAFVDALTGLTGF